jgi:hypothetical protein
MKWPFLLLGAVLCVSIVGFVFTPEGQELLELLAIRQQSAEHQLVQKQKVRLCRRAAVCRQYDAARLECATAENFNRCLKIKMSETDYTICTNFFEEGAPAVPPPLGTPTLIETFSSPGNFELGDIAAASK